MTDDKDDDKKSGEKNLTSTANIGFINADGEVTKPVSEAVKYIADKVGVGLASVTGKKVRDAKQDVEADRIRQEGEQAFAIQKVQNQAELKAVKESFVKKEIRQHRNLTNITEEAANNLNEDASPEDISDDWWEEYSDRAKKINDKKAQEIWANLLAENANSKGSFSKSILSILADLDKPDAENFTRVCSFVFNFASINFLFIKDHNDNIYKRNGVNFNMLSSLCEARLMTHESLGLQYTDLEGKNLLCSYFDDQFAMFLKGSSVERGSFALTKAGEELYRICKPEKTEGFFEHMQAKFKEQGHEVKKAILNEKGEYVAVE